jgi:hypothetical protein
LFYKKLVEIQKLNRFKSAKNIAQNAGFCIKIFKIFVRRGGFSPPPPLPTRVIYMALVTRTTKILEGLVKFLDY